MNNKDWNVGCCANDAYAQHTGVMLHSMLKNCSVPQKIRIFLVDGGMSSLNKKKIEKVVTSNGAKIEFIKPDLELVKGLKIIRHLGIDTYNRFSLIENTPVEKMLYLDSDLIVEGDVKEIFDLDFKDNILFAVRDPGVDSKKKKKWGVPRDKHYFSAGVLYIDCKKWRKEKLTEKVLAYLRDNAEKLEFADQDAVNAVLYDRWKEMPLNWNVLIRIFFKNWPGTIICGFTDEEIKRITDNPKIVHYAGFLKPWFFWDFVPLKKRYFHYLKDTPWKNFRPNDKNLAGLVRRLKCYFNVFYLKNISR